MSVNFHIKTKNLDLTPEISNQVHEKMSVIEKYISPSSEQEVLAEIEIGLNTKHKKGDIYKTEVNVSYDGNLYRAETKGNSVSEALDELKDEIGKVIKRKRKKNIDVKRSGGRLIKKLLRKK